MNNTHIAIVGELILTEGTLTSTSSNNPLKISISTSNSHIFGGKPKKNGLKCPKCNKNLYDSHPNITLTSNPAQKEVHCKKCGYHGYRTLKG